MRASRSSCFVPVFIGAGAAAAPLDCVAFEKKEALCIVTESKGTEFSEKPLLPILSDANGPGQVRQILPVQGVSKVQETHLLADQPLSYSGFLTNFQ